MHIRLPPLEEIALRWGEIDALLRKATQRSLGAFEAIDVLGHVIVGRMAIWIAEDDGKILGVLVTEHRRTPRKQVCDIVFLAGRNMDAWIVQLLAAVEQKAAEGGCTEMVGGGRKGWARRVGRWGYEVHDTVSFSKRLGVIDAKKGE